MGFCVCVGVGVYKCGRGMSMSRPQGEILNLLLRTCPGWRILQYKVLCPPYEEVSKVVYEKGHEIVCLNILYILRSTVAVNPSFLDIVTSFKKSWKPFRCPSLDKVSRGGLSSLSVHLAP